MQSQPGVECISHSDRTFLIHLGGKIEIQNRAPMKTRDGLSMAYTPGVARVCHAIHQNPDDVYKLTMKRNMVAIRWYSCSWLRRYWTRSGVAGDGRQGDVV